MTVKGTPLAVRFWAKVAKGDGCWEWTAVRCKGYGMIHAGDRMVLAHRVSWELTYGQIPRDAVVCHACDTPSCVRPDHLFLGTQADNMRDARLKGRADRSLANLALGPTATATRDTCVRGHPYNARNTGKRASGHRLCRACARQSKQRWRAKHSPSWIA